jgi:hypothetical protein
VKYFETCEKPFYSELLFSQVVQFGDLETLQYFINKTKNNDFSNYVDEGNYDALVKAITQKDFDKAIVKKHVFSVINKSFLLTHIMR